MALLLFFFPGLQKNVIYSQHYTCMDQFFRKEKMVEIISGNFHLFLEHLKVSDISAAGLPVFLGIPLQLSIS